MQREVRFNPRSQQEIDAERAEQQRHEPSISYATLTASTEALIAFYQNQADETDDSVQKQTFGVMANGAYTLWLRLAADAAIENDSDRLEALANAIHRPDAS